MPDLGVPTAPGGRRRRVFRRQHDVTNDAPGRLAGERGWIVPGASGSWRRQRHLALRRTSARNGRQISICPATPVPGLVHNGLTEVKGNSALRQLSGSPRDVIRVVVSAAHAGTGTIRCERSFHHRLLAPVTARSYTAVTIDRKRNAHRRDSDVRAVCNRTSRMGALILKSSPSRRVDLPVCRPSSLSQTNAL